MADDELDIADVEDVAFASLDRHRRDAVLTEQQVELFKTKFGRVRDTLATLRANEGALLERSVGLKDSLREEKIALEKAEISKVALKKTVDELMEQKTTVTAELADAEDREHVLQFELNELTQKETGLGEELEILKKKNAELVQPELKRLEDSIAALTDEISTSSATIEGLRTQKSDMTTRVSELKDEKQRLEEEVGGMRIELSKIKDDPDRIFKQTQNVTRACGDMRKTIEGLEVKVKQFDDAITSTNTKIAGVEDECRAVKKKLDGHRREIEQHALGCETVKKSLDVEKRQHRDLLERRVEMLRDSKEVADKLRTAQTLHGKSIKAYDRVKRELRRRIEQFEAAKALLPMSKDDLRALEVDLELHKAQGKKAATELKMVRQSVDVHIHNFLAQEGLEKRKRKNLEELLLAQEELEKERDQWREEEGVAQKHIAALMQKKALKQRELKAAQAKEKSALEEMRVKELTLMDLTKQDAEIRNRLRDCSKMYEVVKNERNSYVNAIQSSSQALAEMRERIKILHNEVDILQNESVAKDKALDKERLAHQTACVERDTARLELNRRLETHRSKQEQVKQQIEEIQKLNSIINGMEREMLVLKKKYEAAVERRNFAGIQLIDRNDELCILYEKSNVHEATLAKGNQAVSELQERIRMLRLEVQELEREVHLTRKIIPSMPNYAEQILDLQKQLAAERQKTEKLCSDLETPQNLERWRALEGDDPDEDQLAAKIKVLEERLNDKKEQILEKDLVLEEVTALAEKLRSQASEGRAGTLQLSSQVNSYQTRIKDTTRSMMAIVSELSMYQATSMKLAQEKEEREKMLDAARARLDAGEAPTATALQTWRRAERRRLQRREDALTRAAKGMPDGVPDQATRTTAEPRPNAYIPEDVGLPQPYGRHAPFKPTEVGSTMRHIRKPEVKDIEI